MEKNSKLKMDCGAEWTGRTHNTVQKRASVEIAK